MMSLLFRRCLTALLFCGGAALAQADDGALRPCHPAGMVSAVLCGSIERPLNPADAAGPRIRIHYAVAPSKARQKQPNPLYFLAGGPGQSAIELMPRVLGAFDRINNRRDIVFVDQRGTGQSAPLVCDDDARLPLAEALDADRQIERLVACRTKLQKLPHGDLRFYTTTLAMHDLDAVRAALGHERINLFGASYGTRAALEYLRLYPQRVRRAVIDGVAPPDMALPVALAEDAQAALNRHFELCEKDADCARRYPQVRQQWRQVLASMPREVQLEHPLTGARERLTLTRTMLLGMARGPLYQPGRASALPPAIAAASEGRFGALLGLAAMDGAGKMKMAMGMHYSVVCAEDMRAAAPVGATGDFAGFAEANYRRICAEWPRGTVDPAFYAIPPAPAPVPSLSPYR